MAGRETSFSRQARFIRLGDVRGNVISPNGLIAGTARRSEGQAPENVLLVPISLRWESIPAYTDGSGSGVAAFDNLDRHIDPWTKVPNGQRIFPCYKNPDSTKLRNAVNVIVSATPALVGKTVKVKSFDVDDSTDESIDVDDDGSAVIDTNGKAGNDNLPDYLDTPQSGRFLQGGSWGSDEAEAVVDANGEARFTLQIGMQPGNNYKVVVTEVDGKPFPAAQVTDSAQETCLGPLPEQTSKVPSTPLLTVWRKLWVENDSMKAIPLDAYGNKLNDLHGTEQVPTVTSVSYDAILNHTKFEIPKPGDMSSFANLQNGRFKIQGNFYPVAFTQLMEYQDPYYPDHYYVAIPGNHSAIPVGSGFRLYDDDDFGLRGCLKNSSSCQSCEHPLGH